MAPDHCRESASDRLLQSAACRIIGQSDMAERIRAFDWNSTAVGPMELWSTQLVTVVNLTLASPSPTRVLWGPELILIYNDAYRPIPGPRHPAALGRAAREVYAESWGVVGPLLKRAFASGEACFYERLLVPLPSADGTRDHFLNYSLVPIFEEGVIAGLFGSFQDVTSEVVAEQKLQQSEARVVRIMQSIGDAVIVTDAETRIMTMNPVAEGLTGWSMREAEGRPLCEVFHVVDESTRETVESPADKVKRLGTIVGLANHTILIRRDSSEIAIDDSGAPIYEEDRVLSGIVIIFRDVSEKRRLEKEREQLLSEVQARYAELEATYENAAIAMAIIDAKDFRYLRANQRLCELLRLPRNQVLGSKVSDVASGVPGIQEAMQQAASGQPVIGGTLEGELSTSPGIKRYWTIDYAPIRNDHGEVVAIAAASAEITLQKQAEAVLMKTEKLAAVGRLASSIAHEINNPLEAVTNLIYLIHRCDLPPQAREYARVAERELQRASAITNQTLRFHRQSTKPTKVHCHSLIEEVLAIFHGRLINSKITVETRYRATRPVLWFEGEIRQVLSNLIGNAIDAMPTDGGRLLVRTREATNHRGERRALITIGDTGTGISRQTSQGLFEPFFTTKDFRGSGLGLWISKEIITRHGGSIRLRSSQRPGKRGTVFSVSLPIEIELQPTRELANEASAL